MSRQTPATRPERASGASVGAGSRARDVAGRDITRVVHREVHHHGPTAPTTAPALPPDVAAYVTWLRGQPTGLNLIGVAGGDMQLELDEVYVPLSLSCGRTGLRAHERPAGPPDTLDECRDTFGLPDLFARVDAHVILLGGAGTGKTTALRKLVQLCLPSPPAAKCKRSAVVTGPETIHLARGYVPIFVPLRRFTRADMDRSLAEFLGGELARAARNRPNIQAVLEHPHLLVLLDGLDEIADPELRADFCAHLGQQLRRNEYAAWRVVVTSRPAGYGRDRCRLAEDQFTEAALQPLGREQVPELVDRWFREAALKLDGYGQERATRDAEELKQALARPDFGQRMEVMFATPLLLTLLCVVVQRGKEMPKSRARFYDECLRVLLERWHAAKDRDGEDPARKRTGKKREVVAVEARPGFLDAEVAIDLLRPIAYELHLHETRDEVTADELALKIHTRLQALQRREDADDVLAWLLERAAVIVEFGEGSGRIGLFHLHIQEYLAALHVEREGLLAELTGHFEREWWHEVARLVVSIGGKRTFSALLNLLLTEDHLLDEKRHGVLRDMFVDAREVDLEPVRTRLKQEKLPAPEVLLALMRLVQGLRDPQLAACAQHLAARTSGAVQTAAEHLAVTATPIAGETGGASIAVLAHSVDADHGCALAGHLRRLGMTVWPGSGAPPAFESFDRKRLEKEVKAAALVLGSQPWWTAEAMRARLEMLQVKGVRLVAVRPPGATAPAEALPVELAVDCSAGWDDAELAVLRRRLVPGPDGPVEGQAFVETTTGMRLVWVPGGSFVMGSDKLGGDASPEHRVRVSPFWLGETPVTNRQYEVFLKATGHRRPRMWSDPDFSDPEQPVVTVSWDDAMAFCAWLSEESGLQVTLPSEAQWEFAARGTDGRMYPWGDDPPDPSRACFAAEKPARVGTCLKGQGPFGTLDQAGNVWEWCLDVWNGGIYAERARRKTEVVDKGDTRLRSLRGGSWRVSIKNAAEGLAAAFRFRYWRGSVGVHSIGFRVVVVPASRPSRP